MSKELRRLLRKEGLEKAAEICEGMAESLQAAADMGGFTDKAVVKKLREAAARIREEA